MKVEEMTLAMDFSEVAVLEACAKLGVMPRRASLIVGMSSAGEAQLVAEKFKVGVFLIPNECLISQYAWAVSDGRDWIWSRGI